MLKLLYICTSIFLGALISPWLWARLQAAQARYLAEVEGAYRALMQPPPSQRAMATVGLGLLGTSIALGSWVGPTWGLLSLAIALALPPLLLRRQVQARTQRLESQLSVGLRSISTSTRAGLVLPQALRVVSESLAPPLSQEIAVSLQAYRLGQPLNEALSAMGERVGSRDLQMVLSVIPIAQRSGGRMAHLFEETAQALESIRELEANIQASTAQGRMQAWVLVMMAPAFMGVLHLLSPELVSLLFQETLGHLILSAILGLELAGILALRAVMSIEL